MSFATPEKWRRAILSQTAIKDAKNPGYREQYGVVIVCPDEARQRALYERLHAELKPQGLKVKLVVT